MDKGLKAGLCVGVLAGFCVGWWACCFVQPGPPESLTEGPPPVRLPMLLPPASPAKVGATADAASAPDMRDLAPSKLDAAEFEKQAHKIIDYIAAGSTNRIGSGFAGDSVLVVKRTRVEKQNGKPIPNPWLIEESLSPDKRGKGKDAWSNDPISWQEWERTYSLNDEADDEGFAAIVAMFQKLVNDTRDGYSGEHYSLTGIDHWDSRCLGPCVSGKVCSNCEWYATFVKEEGDWHLHRLEIASR